MIITLLLLIIFIGGPSWVLWITLSPMWYGQKRWVVWYPPELGLVTAAYSSASWSVPLTYYTAKDYAEIFNGEVYRVR